MKIFAMLALLLLLFSCDQKDSQSSSQSPAKTETAPVAKTDATSTKAAEGEVKESVDFRMSTEEADKIVINDDTVEKMAAHIANAYCVCLKDEKKDLDACRKASYDAEQNMKKFESKSYRLWKTEFRKGIDNCPK